MRFKTRISLVSILVILSTFMLATASFAYYNDQTITPAPNPSNNVSSSKTWTYTDPNYDSKLFVSNDPEATNQYGILAKDSEINGTGMFRVFWTHINNTGGNGYIGFGLKNTGTTTAKVYFKKRAYGIGSISASLGQQVFYDWLQSSSSEYLYATLNPGQYTWVSFLTSHGQACTGMYDVVIKDSYGNLRPNGIQLRTYITWASGGDPSSIWDNTALPRDGLSHTRARFDHASKYLNWSSAATNSQITFTSKPGGNNWPTPTNDLDRGYSETDNNYQYNYGNYGQDLNITVQLSANSALVLDPSLPADNNGGNTTHYLATYVSNRGNLRKTLSSNTGWVITTGSAGQTITVKTSLPAFEMAPLHLVVLPN